ncbi:MAG: phosphohydrolase [Clostridia bacterium]|jgi:HD-GYP domain-containing protein (c-di-GMP phosphodiesterase class II)|nr:phosphohydrolase [Clostridia bacterium]
MRLFYLSELEPGMVLAKPVYSEDGRCLVNFDFVLTEKIIERIKTLDYERVWIKDDFDDVSDYLSDELKLKAVRSIKSIFTGYATNKKANFDIKKIDVLKDVVENVVEEIISNRQCVIQLSNLRNFNNSMYEHAVDVARVSVLIGVNMGLNKAQLCALCEAAMMHDIGKTQLSGSLLSKTTEYTKEEMEEMTKHPALGYRMMKDTDKFKAPAYIAVLQHHERFDGTGFPEGIKGEKINQFSRIIKIADVYSNMRSGTINTQPYSQSEVIEYFYADGSRQFDPNILKVFLSKVPIYEVGQVIKLSNGQKAFVAQNNEGALARPIVRVMVNDKTVGEEIDLSKNFNITIVS